MKDKFNKFIDEMLITSNTHIRDDDSKSFVMALNAPWGSGKTTFINNFIKDNDKNNYEIIKYDAWENDYWDNPFEPIIHNIFNSECFSRLLINSQTMSILKTTLSSLVRSCAKKFFVNKIGEDGVQSLENLANKPQDMYKCSGISKIFKEYDDFTKNIIKFKEELSKLQISLGKKIVIIVDELDRCKPDFAVKTLEFIKHLFNVKDYIFIVAIDKKAMISTIKAFYGESFDSSRYLNRFFDYTINMPQIDKDKYLNKTIASYHLSEQLEYFLKYFLTIKEHSFRELKTFFVAFDLYSNYFKKTKYTNHTIMLTFFIYLKIFDEVSLNKIIDINSGNKKIYSETYKNMREVYDSNILEPIFSALNNQTTLKKFYEKDNSLYMSWFEGEPWYCLKYVDFDDFYDLDSEEFAYMLFEPNDVKKYIINRIINKDIKLIDMILNKLEIIDFIDKFS